MRCCSWNCLSRQSCKLWKHRQEMWIIWHLVLDCIKCSSILPKLSFWFNEWHWKPIMLHMPQRYFLQILPKVTSLYKFTTHSYKISGIETDDNSGNQIRSEPFYSQQCTSPCIVISNTMSNIKLTSSINNTRLDACSSYNQWSMWKTRLYSLNIEQIN